MTLVEGQDEPDPPPGWFELTFYRSSPPSDETFHLCRECGPELRDAAAQAFDAEPDEEEEDGEEEDEEAEEDDGGDVDEDEEEDDEEPE